MEPMLLALVLLGIAVGLAMLDLLIPSHGLLVLSACVLAVVAIGIGFSIGIRQGAMLVALVGLLTPIIAGLMIKWWPHTPIGKRVLLSRPSLTEVLPDGEAELQALVGRLGRAKTDLLPNGSVVIGNRSWDALSDGKAIDAGAAVKVTEIRARRLVVRPASADDLASAATPTDEAALLAQPVDDWDFDEESSQE